MFRAKNVQVLNVNAKLRTSLLVEIVFWLVVKTAANVHQELNASPLQEEYRTARAPRATEHSPMVVALTSMNVSKIDISADLEPNALIDPDHMNVSSTCI